MALAALATEVMSRPENRGWTLEHTGEGVYALVYVA